jgi:hypothetical protein
MNKVTVLCRPIPFVLQIYIAGEMKPRLITHVVEQVYQRRCCLEETYSNLHVSRQSLATVAQQLQDMA